MVTRTIRRTKAVHLQPQPVREFTREEPCTKIDLWNCFASPSGFRKRAIVEARGIIGVNAIKYLLREGYAIQDEMGGVAYWELTPDGEQWLLKGTTRYVEIHPERVNDLLHPLPAVLTRSAPSARRGRIVRRIR